MKRSLIFTILMLCMLVNSALAADFSKLVIMHTNDTHGFDERADGINGMATVAAMKKDFEAKGYQVLLFDAGDAIQDNNLVNFSKGASAISFMNAAGYDAMTLGNHEFDYGQDVTLKRVKEAKFPVVSANVEVMATGKSLIPCHTIIKKDDLKIGVFGLTTPTVVVSTNPKNVKGLKVLEKQEMYAKAQQEIDELRGEGCDLVIALTHLGSEPSAPGNRSDDLLANVRNLDICIDGHDHQVKNQVINGILLAETGCYTKNIGVITYDKTLGWQEQMKPFGAFTKEDVKVKKIITREAAKVKKELSRKIGTTAYAFNGNRFPGVRTEETNLGNFVADAYLWQGQQANVLKGKVDAAIANGGGIRASIPAGTITLGNLNGVAPYNNYLYIVEMKGSKLLEILEAATSTLPQGLGAFPQVAGIKYTVNMAVPYQASDKKYSGSTYYAPLKPGSRVTIHEVGGRAFAPEDTYSLVSTDFVCNGGDAYGGLTEPGAKVMTATGYTDLQAMDNYLTTELKGVVPERYKAPQGRIVLVK